MFRDIHLIIIVACTLFQFGLAATNSTNGTNSTNTTTAPPTPSPNDAARNVPVINISSLAQCPFSRWNGAPRYCYECRWCPFRSSSCCEMEDEIDVLKSVNVSGSDEWNCFITIVHFQQCGRCSPEARSLVQQVAQREYGLDYVWNSLNLSIRPCKQACQYIWKQCGSAKKLDGTPVVPPGMGDQEFCKWYPEYSTPDTPCYNRSTSLRCSLLSSVAYCAVLLAIWFFKFL